MNYSIALLSMSSLSRAVQSGIIFLIKNNYQTSQDSPHVQSIVKQCCGLFVVKENAVYNGLK